MPLLLKMAKLSSQVIRRLILYHDLLSDYSEKGIAYVSSPQLAALLKVDDSQVRKDILLCHKQGKSKVGYPIRDLKQDIERFLGLKKKKKAIVIGAGNLGSALAKYADFNDYGIEIVGLFDSDKNKIGQTLSGKRVYDMRKISELISESGVEIAILTVPRAVAQSVADLLVKAKIKYIWNFTPTVLSLPDEVYVCHDNLMGNFLPFIYDK